MSHVMHVGMVQHDASSLCHAATVNSTVNVATGRVLLQGYVEPSFVKRVAEAMLDEAAAAEKVAERIRADLGFRPTFVTR